MAKKKKAQLKTTFVLHNGTTYDVTGENGKYIICGNTQFRKSANRGDINRFEVTDEPEKAPDEA